jgi:hypothetical protein
MAGFGGHLFNLTRLFAGPPSNGIGTFFAFRAALLGFDLALTQRYHKRCYFCFYPHFPGWVSY